MIVEPCCAYTLQRSSWLLPIVDHGVDQDDDVSLLNNGGTNSIRLEIYFKRILFCQVNQFEKMRFPEMRRFIWKLFEEPDSSTAAKVAHYIVTWKTKTTCQLKVLVILSSIFLLSSILMLILSTVPEFQV